jgi:hypothetical protein
VAGVEKWLVLAYLDASNGMPSSSISCVSAEPVNKGKLATCPPSKDCIFHSELSSLQGFHLHPCVSRFEKRMLLAVLLVFLVFDTQGTFPL